MRSTLVGLIYGSVTMFFLSFIIALLANFGAVVMSFGGWLWFFLISIFPVAIISGISGYFQAFRSVRLWVYWILCAFLGFIIVLYAGSVGTTMMLILKYGFEYVMNTSNPANGIMHDYFKLAPKYALMILPVSTLFFALWLKALQALLTYVENKNRRR
jgi:Na+-driven multidrug efflux pump